MLAALRTAGVRADTIAANDGLGKRIRSSKLEKIPYILVVGDDDVAHRTVGVNPRGGQGDEAVERGVDLAAFIARLVDEVASSTERALNAT